jgi:plastocyanin
MKTLAVLFASTLLLAGCSGSSSDGASPDRTTASPTDVSDDLAEAVDEEAGKVTSRTVSIVIKDGKVTPQGDRVQVKVGQTIRLKITSDADEEIHVHSDPEHSYEVAAGESVTESFTIDTPGQVAVEAHHLDVTIMQLVVRP